MEFRTRLIAFLRQCKCPDDRIFSMLQDVFFEKVRVQLVTSIPGLFTGKNKHEFGHLRLRGILHSLSEFERKRRLAPPNTFPPILSLCSSLGNPSSSWLRSFLQSCYGGQALPLSIELGDLFHMVFPTLPYVRSSRIGEDGAGSLILQRKHFYSKSFPRQCMKRYKDAKGRENCLPHAKYCKCSGYGSIHIAMTL